uniref:ABC transporter ATP-binding protein n=1 Tax=Agathobacter sp. TaxID=2021311 RepID=UPI0040298CC9
MSVDEKEVFEICNQVDSFIAAELTESIVIGTSYDMLEAHHGILPISRNCFYRKRRIVQRIMKQRMGQIVEEKNGQLRMVW